MRRLLTTAGLLLSVIILGGCDATTRAPEVAAPCEHMGDPCRLPSGPMGVCNETTAPCESPPCLACISQH
ncbi:MAG: hypothetical protein AB7S26_22035 [Sandaracinaceae bacterium]